MTICGDATHLLFWTNHPQQHSSRLVTYTPGTIIAHQGEVGLGEIKIISKGTCKVMVDLRNSVTPVYISATGFETNVDLGAAFLMGKKGLIGDIPVLLDLPEPAYIVAVDTVEVLVFREDEIKQGLFQIAPELFNSKWRSVIMIAY